MFALYSCIAKFSQKSRQNRKHMLISAEEKFNIPETQKKCHIFQVPGCMLCVCIEVLVFATLEKILNHHLRKSLKVNYLI